MMKNEDYEIVGRVTVVVLVCLLISTAVYTVSAVFETRAQVEDIQKKLAEQKN